MRLLVPIFFLVMLLAALLAPRLALAQAKDEPARLWPADIRGWQWDGTMEEYNKGNLFDFMDGAAEVYLAYNFRALTVVRFGKTGRPRVQAELYSMGSPEDAFGVFSLERQDPEAGVGQGSEFGGGMLRFWKGPWFVSIFSEGEGRDADEAVLDLGRAVASAIKETGNPPELLRYLPEPVPAEARFLRSHVLLNQRFFISNKNILQLQNDVKAVIAPYAVPQGKAYLLLVQYPLQARAVSAYRTFDSEYMTDTRKEGLMVTGEGKWTRAERYADSIIIVFNAPSEAEAERLVKAAEARLKGGHR